jgi:uncharacterized integral membrane protein
LTFKLCQWSSVSEVSEIQRGTSIIIIIIIIIIMNNHHHSHVTYAEKTAEALLSPQSMILVLFGRSS